MNAGSIDYACARVAARYGARPDEALWHRLESPRTLSGLLDSMRGTSLEPWIATLTPQSGAHAIDARVRDQWRRHAGEVARWMPAPWQAATAWWAVLPDIPIVDHIARRGPTLPWLERDARYRAVIETKPGHVLAPLLVSSVASRAHAWQVEWKRRLPRGDRGPLATLERLVAEHLSAFRTLAPGDGTPLRRALAAQLATLYRRAVCTPAAVFSFLALVLIDAERLRGELQRRTVFPGRALAP